MAKTSTPKEPIWKPFSRKQYREAIFRLVHFSVKTVNSNAKAAGIRLSTQQARPLPYLCASSALASGCALPLDYLTNGTDATIAKQVDLVLAQSVPERVPSEEVESIRQTYQEASREGFEAGMEKVSPRVRQLLLPRPDGTYVAVTPLTSSGLTATVRERAQQNQVHYKEVWADYRQALEKHRKARHAGDNDIAEPERPRLHRLTAAYLGFGGDNAQNIGRLASRNLIQHPLFFGAPQQDTSIREQYSAAHRGVWPLISYPIMRELRDYALPLLLRYDGVLPFDMKTREQVDRFIDRLVSSLLQRAAQARQQTIGLMTEEIEKEQENRWAHLPTLQQGLIEPSLRDRKWREALSVALTQAIDEYAFSDEAERGRLSFDRAWLVRIQNRISEGLL